MKRTVLVVAAAVVAAASMALSGLALAKERAVAEAEVINTQGQVIGKATFTQRKGDKVKVDVRVGGLEPGMHGIHIHSVGLCQPPAFASAGAHFTRAARSTGSTTPKGRTSATCPT